MKHIIPTLVTCCWTCWALAEIPLNLDEALFGIVGGTNYVKWMTTEGTIVFPRPFVIFDRAQFRMYYPTSGFAPRHYSIAMEREFPHESSSTNLVDLIQKAESILLKSFKGRSFKRQYDGTRYQSSCVDIAGLGWDAWFYVMPMTNISNTFFVARSRFYNSLHREGRFISCEDFECENSKNSSEEVVPDESITFNTIDSILLQAILYSKVKGCYPDFSLIEIPIHTLVKKGCPADQYGRAIRYSATNDVLEVRSAGRDGLFETDDDIVGTISLEQFGRRIIGKYGTFFSGSEL